MIPDSLKSGRRHSAVEQAVEAADRPRTAARSLTAKRSTDEAHGDGFS
jgi:hypothetical protein